MAATQFAYIDASDEYEKFAVDTDGQHYLILWYDAACMTEQEAREVAVPITERFPNQESRIPARYLDAWTGNAEEWSK